MAIYSTDTVYIIRNLQNATDPILKNVFRSYMFLPVLLDRCHVIGWWIANLNGRWNYLASAPNEQNMIKRLKNETIWNNVEQLLPMHRQHKPTHTWREIACVVCLRFLHHVLRLFRLWFFWSFFAGRICRKRFGLQWSCRAERNACAWVWMNSNGCARICMTVNSASEDCGHFMTLPDSALQYLSFYHWHLWFLLRKVSMESFPAKSDWKKGTATVGQSAFNHL